MAGNILDFTGNLVLSPFYGLTESLANIGIPGAEDALDWGIFSGVPDFQDEHPGWALGAEIASYLIPGAGWANATRRGAGLMGAAMRGAAGLGGTNNAARFVLGETARWAPFNAGLTAFDAAAGRYDSGGEAANMFLFGTGLGVAVSALGASPTALRTLAALPGIGPTVSSGVKYIFGPTAENRAVYGLGPEVADAPQIEALISQFDPGSPTQLWGRQAKDILEEVRAGTRTDMREPDVLGVIDQLKRESLQEEVGPGEGYVRLPYPTAQPTRNFLNREFTPGQSTDGGRLRERLAYQPGSLRDVGKIQEELKLPKDFEFLGRFYRHISTERRRNADSFRAGIGLKPSKTNHGFRRVDRLVEELGPDGTPTGFRQQTWSIRQEDDGMWILATELPQAGTKSRFLVFKTDVPDAFFPDHGWMRNVDDPRDTRAATETLGGKAWDSIDDLPEHVAPFIDAARGLKSTILSPDNFRAYARASRKGIDSTKELAKRFGAGGDVPGLNAGKIIEGYFKPTMFQFRNNPLAAMVYQMRRAVFDGGEALKQEIVYGKQSLNRNKSILSAVFGRPIEDPSMRSIYSEAQRLLSDDAAREQWRKLYFEDQLPLEQWPAGPAREFQEYALSINKDFVDEMNKTLKALKDDPLSVHSHHVGVGHMFDGSNHYPVYDVDNKVVALGTGHSAEAALRNAQEWINWRRDVKRDPRDFRIGDHFTGENFSALPKNVREAFFTPGFYRPQSTVGGFKWERESIRSVDDLIEAFDKSYSARTRHLADRVGSALTYKEHQKVLRQDPTTGEILDTRLNALKGVPGSFDRLQNRVLDKMLAPVIGTNSATKIANKVNEAMHHLSFGMGNIGYPILNVTSLFQTSLPEVTNILASADDDLARMAYYLPTPGANGKPRGITAMYHAPGSMWRAVKLLKNPTDAQRDIFERLAQDADLGPRFTEEYLGQNRQRVMQISEGIKSPDDFVKWIGALSSLAPAQTEKFARTFSAAMAIDSFERLAKIRGQEFTTEQMFRNVQNFVRRTNYLYSTADRPQIFTTPLGSLFGGFKNWMMHYLFAMADYTGLAARGNFAPLLMATSSMAGLGGLFAVPFLASGLDWTTETFADQDLMEYLYSNLGDGANGVAFGLPAAMGLSMSGATAAPGSKFAHDLEFMFTVVSLNRMSSMASAVGRYWDNVAVTGGDPWQDPVFKQRMMQGFAPRSFYRTYDVVVDDSLNSARTGYATVEGLNPMERWYHAMGFTSTRVEREYAVYDRLLRDETKRREQVSLFGEAYFQASVAQDQDLMEDIIRMSAVRGLDLSSILRSAERRARDAGVDMFGRVRGDGVGRYEAVLGRETDGFY